MILVTGTITAKPDTIEEVLRVSRKHIARSSKEPCCISQHVTIDADDKLTLHFIERCADEAALKNLAADSGALHIYQSTETTV